MKTYANGATVVLEINLQPATGRVTQFNHVGTTLTLLAEPLKNRPESLLASVEIKTHYN